MGNNYVRQRLANGVRLQQAPIWHYINSNQWRYDGNQADYNTVPKNELSSMHSADMVVKSVKNGWMPFYPQYNKNPLDIVPDAEKQVLKLPMILKTMLLIS